MLLYVVSLRATLYSVWLGTVYIQGEGWDEESGTTNQLCFLFWHEEERSGGVAPPLLTSHQCNNKLKEKFHLETYTFSKAEDPDGEMNIKFMDLFWVGCAALIPLGRWPAQVSIVSFTAGKDTVLWQAKYGEMEFYLMLLLHLPSPVAIPGACATSTIGEWRSVDMGGVETSFPTGCFHT